MWVETHCHLSDSQFDSDRQAVISSALSAGVGGIIEIADGPDEWAKAQKLAEQHSRSMGWAAGIHPYYSNLVSDATIEQLRDLSHHPQFVGLGEMGLDYAKSTVSPEVQKMGFQRLIELGLEIQKPFIIHCRNAFDDLISILKNSLLSKNKPSSGNWGVIHCFTGSKQEGLTLIEMGFFLGVDAPITYPSARLLRDALIDLPLESLVLETDSPYLPPQVIRGKRNEPQYIPDIGQALAELKRVPLNTLKSICTDNSRRLFPNASF